MGFATQVVHVSPFPSDPYLLQLPNHSLHYLSPESTAAGAVVYFGTIEIFASGVPRVLILFLSPKSRLREIWNKKLESFT